MLDRTPLIVTFLALTGLLAIALWIVGRPEPVLTKNENDIDATVLGDSATDNHSGDAPAYMNSNWAWPMPLQLWNPATTVRH